MTGGWGCPHEDKGQCRQVRGRACDPGMKGCVLYGRFRFANNEAKNEGLERRARAAARRRGTPPPPALDSD